MPKLILATHNDHKLVEFRALLADLPWEINSLGDIGLHDDVEETEPTFEGNACLKALDATRRTGLIALSDDSGLEVDFLNGEPGVYSKRYAGEGADDADRRKLILQKLKDVPAGQRTGRFRCVIAIVIPSPVGLEAAKFQENLRKINFSDALAKVSFAPPGAIIVVEGRCEGEIAFGESGKNGFGYDPIFYVPSEGRTLAELTPGEKNRISHRGEASKRARLVLEKLADNSETY